ncbi:MAG TPA: pitrilysin family protein [Bacillota bacterium]|nr:pitrilysin family protein [Bacillota bacterium]
MIVNRTLSNGIRMVMEKLPAVQSVSIGIWVKAGSVDEKPANSGISHLIEHMMFKGTEKRSAKKIAEDVDRIGGHMNALTGKEATCYYIKTLHNNIDKACDIIIDMFLNSQFDPGELAKEKDVIYEEIKMIEDNPEDHANELLLEMVFHGTSLERPIIGTRESLEGISRDMILDYIAREYTTDSIVISVAGNFDEDHVYHLFDSMLPHEKTSKAKKTRQMTSYVPSYQVRVKDVEQSHICMGIKGVPHEDKLYYPMVLLNSIVGGSMSSRLFQKIREQKGLAYSVYSGFSSYVTDGIYSIYAGVGHSKVEEAIEAIAEEMRLIKAEGISEDELAIAKEQMKSSYVFSQENVNNRMYVNGKHTLLLSRLLTTQEILDRIDRVDMDALNEAASIIADMDRYSVVLISNRDYDIQSQFDDLKG